MRGLGSTLMRIRPMNSAVANRNDTPSLRPSSSGSQGRCVPSQRDAMARPADTVSETNSKNPMARM